MREMLQIAIHWYQLRWFYTYEVKNSELFTLTHVLQTVDAKAPSSAAGSSKCRQNSHKVTVQGNHLQIGTWYC